MSVPLSVRRSLLTMLGVAAVLALVAALARTSAARPYDLPDYGHLKGKRAAPVTIVEFVDFSCPACGSFARETMPQLEREWISTGRARLRVIPFDALRSGHVAAQAAQCAAQQDRFWPMHDLLFQRQKEWLGVLGRKGQRLRFAEWAAGIGLDSARFQQCINSKYADAVIARNTRLARETAVPGTPAFVVNGQVMVGALPYRDFAAALAR